MASPFTITSVSNYNSNPPSDDGAQTASNRLQWSTHITKIGNPIKTAFDSSETATSTAFGKIIGGAGITTTATNYTVTSSDQGKLVKVTVSGKTITTPDATVVNSPFVFAVLNNSTGDITLDGNGTQTVDGNLTVTVPAGCGCFLNTDGSNWFSFGLNYNNVLQHPEGYLTMSSTSDSPIITGDVTAASSVYYSPFGGDRVPCSTDGVTFKMRQFTQMTLTLVANHLASTLYDVFLFDNSGTLTIGTGPAWNSSTSRGSGAGTTDIQKIHGLLVNVNSMTARNGSTTYTVAANQGLYVGTIYIDGSAGQVSCYRTAGQNRKWGVWNAYNRQPIVLQVMDSTSSWSLGGGGTGGYRAVNGSSSNVANAHTGLAEEPYTIKSYLRVSQTATANQSSFSQSGIGMNSTITASGLSPPVGMSLGSGVSGNTTNILTPVGNYVSTPLLGVMPITALEGFSSTGSPSAPTGSGGAANNLMTVAYRG